MAVRLKCGHNSDWTVRLIDRGQRFTFCLGCMFEKVGMKDINGLEPPKAYPVGYTPEEEKKTTKKTEPKKVEPKEE